MKLITTQKLNKQDTAVTTSRQVAEYFGKQHYHVTDAIEKLTHENMGVKKMFILSSYVHKGNTYKQYIMTRDGFTLLAMGFTGAKALEFKLQFIEAFNSMETMLVERKVNRELTRKGYIGVTSKIRETKGDKAKFYHFTTEADMFNRIVFGLTSKQYKDVHGVEPREGASANELSALDALQRYDEMLLDLELTFAERQERCEEYNMAKLRKRVCNAA